MDELATACRQRPANAEVGIGRKARLRQKTQSSRSAFARSSAFAELCVRRKCAFVDRAQLLELASIFACAHLELVGAPPSPAELELKLGLGGTSYEDFIRNMHLPLQLSQVDPIVASFSGGAVGVISALMLVEANNVEQQEKKRCKYCHGTGYLACARCSASGVLVSTEPVSINGSCEQPLRAPSTQRCQNCSGAGKVMCPTCLCTGMVMASEHDPRIDPFD